MREEKRLQFRSTRLITALPRVFALLIFFASIWGEASLVSAQSRKAPSETNPGGEKSGKRPENPDVASEARSHFNRGFREFEKRHYREAIREFELAAKLVPSADLWYNIARAHEELSEYGPAIEAFRRYLRDRVDPPDRARVEARIKSLAERLKEQQEKNRTGPKKGELSIRGVSSSAQLRVGGKKYLFRTPQ